MLRYFKIPFILTVMLIALAVITNTFTTINIVDFTIAFGIAVAVSFFIEYTKVQSKYLLIFKNFCNLQQKKY